VCKTCNDDQFVLADGSGGGECSDCTPSQGQYVDNGVCKTCNDDQFVFSMLGGVECIDHCGDADHSDRRYVEGRQCKICPNDHALYYGLNPVPPDVQNGAWLPTFIAGCVERGNPNAPGTLVSIGQLDPNYEKFSTITPFQYNILPSPTDASGSPPIPGSSIRNEISDSGGIDRLCRIGPAREGDQPVDINIDNCTIGALSNSWAWEHEAVFYKACCQLEP